MRPTNKEVNALVELLEEDWDDAEDLAVELIKALDKARADRTLWLAVMQFGKKKRPYYLALGPFAGSKSAAKSAQTYYGASLAHKIVTVPMMNHEGIKKKLKEVG